MNTQELHIPVMGREIVHYLGLRPGMVVVDATMNGGGHTVAILSHITPDGRVVGIEWDPEIAQKMATKAVDLNIGSELTIANRSYTELPAILDELGIAGINGIVFDLGISSWHVDGSSRGFTFQKDQLLDMRFAPDENRDTAAVIVNSYSEEQLAQMFYEFGEEQFGRRIAHAIVLYRKHQRILTTGQLVEIIKAAVPGWYTHRRIHYATKVFQALRIAVNQELQNIQEGIEAAIQSLTPQGRICVISFHSLEDRIVKNIFRSYAQKGIVGLVTKKPVQANEDELSNNPRARSAKLRIAQKL